MTDAHILRVALAQIAPVWLNKVETISKIETWIKKAAKEEAELVVFGESLLPGYPYWISLTNGSAFNSKIQKEINAHYIRNAVEIESGDLNNICELAKQHKIAIYIGVIEKALNRGNHSIYCTLVYINQLGEIRSVHRKLQPTFEERLTWAPGDGHGLRTHSLKAFTVGGLNCWENWMPLSRTALYAMGEDLHIAVWPGAKRNTENITRFIAEESRSYSIGVSGLMRKSDFPSNTPHLDIILENAPEILSDGGSCIAGPDGKWIVEPVINKEYLIVRDLNFNSVLEERQNFDVAGHYSRPDVTKLFVNRERQSLIEIKD
ncbi:carbon-nitrogen hydrolase family protein [Portibacter lacus]|uniref:Nitrilase n=1 Tax=Portibacter lacus TaxID=1099794 RepID=A0AA37WE25_9BACT|nr:carbon-nitrogen hydrolase family protein [Portibacter lacus]GLR16199.1 nitrilase [Portibacter lacus]